MHFGTLSTGIMHFAPLNKAVAMVEVARSTSMITTMVFLTSYKCSRAGDNEVYKVGFRVFMILLAILLRDALLSAISFQLSADQYGFTFLLIADG
jgi:Gpi18-like mannosyltransferase